MDLHHNRDLYQYTGLSQNTEVLPTRDIYNMDTQHIQNCSKDVIQNSDPEIIAIKTAEMEVADSTMEYRKGINNLIDLSHNNSNSICTSTPTKQSTKLIDEISGISDPGNNAGEKNTGPFSSINFGSVNELSGVADPGKTAGEKHVGGPQSHTPHIKHPMTFSSDKNDYTKSNEDKTPVGVKIEIWEKKSEICEKKFGNCEKKFGIFENKIGISEKENKFGKKLEKKFGIVENKLENFGKKPGISEEKSGSLGKRFRIFEKKIEIFGKNNWRF